MQIDICILNSTKCVHMLGVVLCHKCAVSGLSVLTAHTSLWSCNVSFLLNWGLRTFPFITVFLSLRD
jgi:hypothetical protein